ncbi:MAG: hypothetical protein ACXVA9_04445 [Bdellovibrionales bacterium]
MTKEREPDAGELRGIKLLEKLEKAFKRPESRVDAQRMLTKVSADAQAYAKHLVMSGPTSLNRTAESLDMEEEKLEAAAQELELAIASLRV